MANFPVNIFVALRSKGTGKVALRMAPLIDVIFLLLIFFLVSACWNESENFLPLEIDAAKAGDVGAGVVSPLVIRIGAVDEGCVVLVEGHEIGMVGEQSGEVEFAEILENVRKLLLRRNRRAGDPVEIDCDLDVRWSELARVYNVLYGSGLRDITFQMRD